MGGCKDQFIAARGGGFLSKEREGDDGFEILGDFVQQLCLKIVRDEHFTGGHLPGRSADEAKLAVPQAFSASLAHRTYGRAEDPAGHGPPRVDVAAAGCGVERGTGGFVGEALEALPLRIGFSEHTRPLIAGKIRAVFCKPGAGAALDRCGKLGIGLAQLAHSGLKAHGVERIHGEGAVAALRAADAAGEKSSGAARRIGEGVVHNPHKVGIARGKAHEGKDTGLRQRPRRPEGSKESLVCAIVSGRLMEVET